LGILFSSILCTCPNQRNLCSLIVSVTRQSKNVWQRFSDRFLKRPLLTFSRSYMNVANSALWRMVIILKVNKVNLFVYSVLFYSGSIHRMFWTHHVVSKHNGYASQVHITALRTFR
jgi:hypothetical protein